MIHLSMSILCTLSIAFASDVAMLGQSKSVNDAIARKHQPILRVAGVSLDCACDALFSYGDIVVTTIDNPENADYLPIGTTGTVLCATTWEEIDYIYVSWDNWTSGHNSNTLCACGDGTDQTDGSHWWVRCGDVEFNDLMDCVCESSFAVGDRVACLVDYPSGNVDIVTGDLGTVVCGAVWDENRILVDWDNFTNGHDGDFGDTGDVYCACGEDGLPTGSTSGWFLECVEIELHDCTGDINGSGEVDVSDLLEVIAQWGTCSASCTGDVSGDGVVDVTDLLELIAAWGPCGIDTTPGACMLNDFTCDVLIEYDCDQLGGISWQADSSCTDSDNDRIPDVFERGDCSDTDGGFTGSDPTIADTDGDGIKDGDEAYGSVIGLDLPSLGCNACKIDLLIETDWLYATGVTPDRNKLHTNQVNRIVAAFANAPVTNPDGSTGITIHIDYGQSPYNGGNSVIDPSGDNTINMSNWDLNGSEYQSVKNAHFASNRHGYFRYCLMSDKYSVAGNYVNSSGLAELQGDDFIVTMGQWATGDDDFIGNTFMHELGHNLNLLHGGNENRNFKPNYNSIMNYWYQFCGIDTDDDTIPDQSLDYSSGSNMSLLESSLFETEGVTGIGPPIDWNQDGDAIDELVQRNINCRITNTYANSNCGSHAHQSTWCTYLGECYDTTCDELSDYDDWSNITFSGIYEADIAAPEVIHCVLDGSR